MRIRTIKPEFFSDSEVVALSFKARLAFIGLWLCADKAGRLLDRPRDLKLSLFPDQDVDMAACIAEMVSRALVTRYVVKEKPYLQITGFERHQRISGTELQNPPRHPGPEEGSVVEALEKQRGSNNEAARTAGREGNGVSDSLSENPHRDPSIADVSRPPAFTTGFVKFWITYPARNGTKRGKAACWKLWQSMKLEPLHQKLVGVLNKQKIHKQRCDAMKVFHAEFPDPERWLKHRRWNDEVNVALDVDDTPSAPKENRLLTPEERAR